MKNKAIKPRCELVNNETGKELFLYGTVLSGKSWWYDEDEYICPQNVTNALKEANGEDIVVRINTNGGDVFAGISIYNTLKDYSGKITVKVDGIAASIGSVIAMAGDEIKMGVGAMLMIHNPWTFTYGNANELRKVAEDLDKMSESIIEIYMTRFKGEKDELKSLLDIESFLTSKESIALGLADDEVSEEDKGNDDQESKQEVKNSIVAKYMAKRNESRQKSDKGSFFMNKFK